MPDAAAAPVSVLMVAAGGYGFHYLNALVNECPAGSCRLAGVVDPDAQQSGWWPELQRLGTPVHADVDAYFAAGDTADLAVVASPIHCHVPQSIAALEHGAHVLCEKPLTATIEEAQRLEEARARTGRWVVMGYQWSFASAIQSLKRDILAGRFGRPLRARTLCLWPRPLAYYRRNSWAGRLRDQATGAWVLDGPANNAMAHFLHNLLFLLGPSLETSATPLTVQAERYRAYDIENGDTVACRITAGDDVLVMFYASHVTRDPAGPMFRIEFEEATVSFGEGRHDGPPASNAAPRDARDASAGLGEPATTGARGPSIVAVTRDGQRVDYGDPDATPQFEKLRVAIDRVRHPGSLVCPLEAAIPQTICVNGMQDSMPLAAAFPSGLCHDGVDPARTWVEGLGQILRRCYEQAVTPSDLGVAWAAEGRTVRARK